VDSFNCYRKVKFELIEKIEIQKLVLTCTRSYSLQIVPTYFFLLKTICHCDMDSDIKVYDIFTTVIEVALAKFAVISNE
jgi:hypothetical protein